MVLVFVLIFLFLKRSLLLDFSFNPSRQKHFWFRSILRACMGSVIAHRVKLCTVNRWTWPIVRPTHEQCNSISEMYTSFQVRTATFLVSNLLDICQLSFQDLINQRWLSYAKHNQTYLWLFWLRWLQYLTQSWFLSVLLVVLLLLI
jgi:hypothetical protein